MWLFEQLRGAAVRRAPQEAELFKAEQAQEGEYAGTDALVREVIQNSLDARHGPGPVSTRDEVTHEVMKRLYLTRIPCMFEVLDRLYWDDARGRSRRGMVSKNATPGDLRNRLRLRIRQLEMTYDLQSLNAEQILELLGDEFQPPARAKPKAASA